MHRAPLLAALALLPACGKESASAPASASSSPQVPVAATSAPPRTGAPAVSAAAPTAESAAPSATASASTPASPSADAASSPKPADGEWDDAKEVRVAGSSALGCETKRVREWVRVLCAKPNDTNGTPVDVKLNKAEVIRPGQPIVQIRRAVDISGGDGKTVLVTRYVEGTDVEATFSWSDKEKHLSLFWPGGKPEPLYTGGFK